MRVARCRIYFIPPTQSDEATTGDIFKVVEIGSEEKDSYYEDQDKVLREEDAEEIDEET